MTIPLKIEVTEAMRETATAAIYAHDLLHGIVDKTWANASAAIKAHYGEMATAALTAAFQHPEFLRQIREQVMGCVPDYGYSNTLTMDYHDGVQDGRGETSEETRASLGRLLGEEG